MRFKSLAVGLLVLCLSASGAAADTAVATLVNQTSFEIHQLFLSPSHESHWGPDQLGQDILEPGYEYTLSGMPCGNYDVKLVDEQGDECVITGDYLCGDAGKWILTDEELLDCQGFKTDTASATLINDSSYDIYALFISPSRSNNWGPDQLGDEVLEPGYSFTFSGLPCDTYDMKLVDEDKDVCVLQGVHLCGAEGEAVLTDDELLDCQGWK
jgi:hypothetical protein